MRMRLFGSAGVICAVALAVSAACASHTPKPVTKAPVLGALPAKATFAWVRPSELLLDATTADETSAGTGAARSMRLDVEALLLGQGWSMVPAESAQFVATVAIVQRIAYHTVNRTLQTNQPKPPRCDLTRSGSCPPVPPQQVTVTERVPVGESQAVLAIRRRADGARTERTSPDPRTQQAGGLFVKELIGLLKANPGN